MRAISLARLLMTPLVVMGPVPAWAQSDSAMNAVVQRFERLERQNADLRDQFERQNAELRDQLERQSAELREQVGLLRQELDRFKQPDPDGTASTSDGAPSPAARIDALEEKVEVNAGRLSEHDQVKVESSQRTPLRLKGMLLLNIYRNGRHVSPTSTPREYPISASTAPGPITAGAMWRQSVIGLEFDTPQALLGGQFHGSFFMDMAAGGDSVLNISPRLRTASIDGRWKTRSIFFGQEKPILSPREPTSLAQMAVSPLAGAGNLWRWRPQVRFEQRLPLGEGQALRARIGVSQTVEDSGPVPQQFLSTLERTRPALEGHVQFTRQLDTVRRLEFAFGFHQSTTHVAQISIPSGVVSVDWFINPLRRVELSGFLFRGSNIIKLGALFGVPGFVISTPRPGEIRGVSLRSHGGWTQATILATSRLNFNLQAGLYDPDDGDLLPTSATRNLALVANTFFRVAPNVVWGVELSQTRTWRLAGERPRYDHADLYVAYVF